MNVINQIKPVWYTYNGLADLPEERYVGTIAQELKRVAPYMVGTWEYMDSVTFETTEYLDVDYGAMDFVMINAIQEQQEMIEKLQARNEGLEGLLLELMARIEVLEQQ